MPDNAMTPLEPETIDRCFEALEAAIGRDPALEREFRSSGARFFPAGARRDGSPRTESDRPLAARRHLEWFILEAERPSPAEARIAALIERSAGGGPRGAAVARALYGSHASVFEVTGVEPGRGVELWDMAGLFQCPTVEETGSRVLAEGDVIAGRVFPLGGSLYHLSNAAAVWRNPSLLEALRADLETARAGRAAPVKGTLRLRQSEIEAMFHALPSTETAAAKDGQEAARLAVGEARELLRAAGMEPGQIEAVLQRLAVEDPKRLLPGGGDVLGEILVDLAFETSVDLETARRTLLTAWEAIHANQRRENRAPRASNSKERKRAMDVAAAVAEFDRKRRAGAPIEEVFQDLERDLDLSDPPDESDDEDSPVPDFPGVLAAMVEEFLWDVEREDGPGAAGRFEVLRSFGRFGTDADIGVFENLSGRELLDYTCRWLPESRELAGADASRDLLDALERFAAWAQENHEVRLQDDFAPVLETLRDSLPRIVEANRALEKPAASRPLRSGEQLFELVSPGGGDSAELRDASGEPVKLKIDERLRQVLRGGDLLRGSRRAGGKLAVSACYPPELRRLQQT